MTVYFGSTVLSLDALVTPRTPRSARLAMVSPPKPLGATSALPMNCARHSLSAMWLSDSRY
jgi:hypothetical protein